MAWRQPLTQALEKLKFQLSDSKIIFNNVIAKEILTKTYSKVPLSQGKI